MSGRSLIVPVAAWIIICVHSTSVVPGYTGIDHYHFWTIPHALEDDPNLDVYVPADIERLTVTLVEAATVGGGRRLAAAKYWKPLLRPTATPVLYHTLSWLWSGAYDQDYFRLQILSMLAIIVALALLATVFGFRLGEPAIVFAALAPWCRPYLLDIEVANVHRLLVAGMAAFLMLRAVRGHRARDIGAGALLTWLVLFKPIVAPCAFFIVAVDALRRDGRRLRDTGIGIAVAIVVAVIVTWIDHGYPGAWLTWGTYLLTTMAGLPVSESNQGIASIVFNAVGVDVSAPFAIALSIGGVLLLRRAVRSVLPPVVVSGHAVGLGALTLVLSSNLVWGTYHLLLLVPIVVLVAPRDVPERRVWAALRMPLGMIAALIISTDPVKLIFDLGAPSQMAWTINGGSVLLFALVAVDMMLARRPVDRP